MILVTGATGLVGSYLLQALLQKGETVRAIYRGEKPSIENVDWVKTDLLDVLGLEAAMKGVVQVYHCAAVVSFNPQKRQMMHKINIEGTANVVNEALSAGVQKMVHVSSVAALGRIRQGAMVDEQKNWTPETSNSEYAKSKYLAEMEVWRGIGEGLNAVIVNPSIILGAGDWSGGSSAIFKNAFDEFPWFTEGESGFVDVQDLVKVMMLLMESDITEERFVVGGHNLPYRTVFNSIADAFGKKRPHKKVTPLIAGLVWRLEALKSFFTKKDPLLTKETADTAMTSVHYDSSKLLKALPGFAFSDFEKTIVKTCGELKAKYSR
jgi:dihydroflavonol-4-reductase